MGAIDVWAQITTERMAKQPWLQTLRRWTGQPQDEYLAASVESTLRAMDEPASTLRCSPLGTARKAT